MSIVYVGISYHPFIYKKWQHGGAKGQHGGAKRHFGGYKGNTAQRHAKKVNRYKAVRIIEMKKMQIYKNKYKSE